jgi:copper(I)-binding protein
MDAVAPVQVRRQATRRRRGRRPTVVAATALTAIFVTGCGGALNDYSATERSLPNSTNVDAGPLALRHLRVQVIDGQAGGDSATLRGSLLNLGSDHDSLLRVTTPAADTVTLVSPSGEAADGELPLRPGATHRLQHPTDPAWVLTDLRQPLQVGASVPVTFHFAAQGRVTATVPIAADERPASS